MGEPACLALGEGPQPGVPPRRCSPWQQVWVVAESLASGMGLLIGILIPPNLSCNVWLATQALVLEQVICLIHRNTSPLNWKELYCFVEDLLCLKKKSESSDKYAEQKKNISTWPLVYNSLYISFSTCPVLHGGHYGGGVANLNAGMQ